MEDDGGELENQEEIISVINNYFKSICNPRIKMKLGILVFAKIGYE